MSNTASCDFAPTATLFGRLKASIDRLLLAYAEMTIRNGDIQRFDVRDCRHPRPDLGIRQADYSEFSADGPRFGAIFLRAFLARGQRFCGAGTVKPADLPDDHGTPAPSKQLLRTFRRIF